MAEDLRIGIGTDIHRLERGLRLILGGVEVPSETGAVGHSDADALTHAVTDALLGALAAGDIGAHFSDQDPRWKDADSLKFLSHAMTIADGEGYEVANVDSTIELERPKLREHIDLMRKNLATALGIGIERVSVKAKTGEGVDSVGTGAAVKATAIVLLRQR
ncbi:MAG: 2-C-methyl-D-erythritol 2,4-cyclodiphosphate synthase [Acidobacteriota bacterium]